MNDEEYNKDLDELDRIWPLGKQLIVPDGGTVMVAGAYEGRYCDYVATRYKPRNVIGFEPQLDKAHRAANRLSRHRNTFTPVHRVGLGVHDCMVSMDGFDTDGCHVCDDGKGHAVRLQGIAAVLNLFTSVDLFICNMEGYEIPLLGYLLASGLISKIKSIAVQFHSQNDCCYRLMSGYFGMPMYNDFPTWVYWAKPN